VFAGVSGTPQPLHRAHDRLRPLSPLRKAVAAHTSTVDAAAKKANEVRQSLAKLLKASSATKQQEGTKLAAEVKAIREERRTEHAKAIEAAEMAREEQREMTMAQLQHWRGLHAERRKKREEHQQELRLRVQVQQASRAARSSCANGS
jgi:hypothetical protein